MWKFYDSCSRPVPASIFSKRTTEKDPGAVWSTHRLARAGIPFPHRRTGPRALPAVGVLLPLGARLDGLATLLTAALRAPQCSTGSTAAVVAHSMGGGEARVLAAGLRDQRGEVVRTYVTISSPLGGMVSAGQEWRHRRSSFAPGTDWRPAVVPDGPFYKDPAAKDPATTLPRTWPTTCSSASSGAACRARATHRRAFQPTRPEAQEEPAPSAASTRTSTSILRSPAVANRLNEILAAMR